MEYKSETTIVCDRCGRRMTIYDKKDTVALLDVVSWPNHDWTHVNVSDMGGIGGKYHLCPRCTEIARRKINGTLKRVFGF